MLMPPCGTRSHQRFYAPMLSCGDFLVEHRACTERYEEGLQRVTCRRILVTESTCRTRQGDARALPKGRI
jgi:hypothetical protein